MQQLNVLPINVSKNVDIKDDTATFNSSSSKDDFSQHIDLQLSKNKDVSDSKSQTPVEVVDTKKTESSSEYKASENSNKTPKNSDASQDASDETESANTKQEIAASGNQDAKVLDKETVDESALLMSFLTKADKTLVEPKSDPCVNVDVMSKEQKAKYEAQLLLKSSGLVADLSSVAKAVNTDASSSTLTEQEKSLQALLTSANKTKENSQLNTQALIQENSLKDNNKTDESVDTLTNETDAAKLSSTTKLDKNSVIDSLNKTVKAEVLAQGRQAQSISEIDNDASKVELSSDKKAQQEASQQSFTAALKNLDSSNIKLSPKASENLQTVMNGQSAIDAESDINDEITKLMQKEKGLTKPEASLSAAISPAQNSNSQNSSVTRLVQERTESDVKKANLTEPENALSAKSVEKLIEQSKELGVENKEVTVKTPTKNSTDFSMTAGLMDSSSRILQTAYDNVDQQVAEIFNPTGSSEVSQSQKTNTQLHHETISIFRKDFSNAVKDKVMLMISQKLQQFDITLDPPELGNMQVRVNLQGEQATVNFIVQNQQAKDALEQNMHKLKESLAELGVDVGDANVEQQSQQSDENNESENNNNNSLENTAEASDVVEHNLSARMLNSSTSAVDYYA
jgi:flagellar hook-length control protein FliK